MKNFLVLFLHHQNKNTNMKFQAQKRQTVKRSNYISITSKNEVILVVVVVVVREIRQKELQCVAIVK